MEEGLARGRKAGEHLAASLGQEQDAIVADLFDDLLEGGPPAPGIEEIDDTVDEQTIIPNPLPNPRADAQEGNQQGQTRRGTLLVAAAVLIIGGLVITMLSALLNKRRTSKDK